MKAALAEVFPDVQQQICRWHIQKNVLKNLADKCTRPETQRSGPQASLEERPAYLRLHTMWKSLCEAEDVTAMREKWEALYVEFSDSQQG